MLQNSIQTSINDASTNPSNQCEMSRDDLKKFATLSCVNAKYNYLRQSTLNTLIAKQKCDDRIWMNGRRILQEITNNESTPT
jgi:hypothetical protein